MGDMRLLLVHALFAIVAAKPSIYFPINSQVPPVARVSQAFVYEFSAATFAPLTEVFSYGISNGPAWLSLDSNSRTFSGTPGPADLGAAVFNLTASDSDGSTNMEVTLVVVSSPPPQQSMSILDQLSQAGHLTGPSSLALYPSTNFELSFGSGSFVAPGRNLTYYATLSNHTPLPSWLNFDGEQVKYYGTTPELTASPQFFEVLLIASDVLGFSGAWVSFLLVLTKHQLYFDPWEREIDFNDGVAINFAALDGSLMLNGSPYNKSILNSVNANLPQWLTLDRSSYNITGTPPLGIAIQDINITATDIFGDSASGIVHLQQRSALVTGTPITATRTSHTSSSGTSSQSPTSVPKSISGSRGITKASAVAVTIVVAVFVFIMALLIFWWCMRRRRKAWETATVNPSRRHTTNPILIIHPEGADAEKDAVLPQQQRAAPLLNVEILAPTATHFKSYRRSMATSLEDGDAALLTDFNQSSWGFRPSSHTPHDSMKIPAQMARLSRLPELSPLRDYPRHAFRKSNGLPLDRRLTGVGHRRSPHGSSAHMRDRISVRNQNEISSRGSYSTQSTGMLSTLGLAGAGLRRATTAEGNNARGIRLVNDENLIDPRSLSERRQSYIRRRATSRSPFFGADTSRASSQSKRLRDLSLAIFSDNSGSPTRRTKQGSPGKTLSQQPKLTTGSVRKGNIRPFRSRIAEGFPRVASGTWTRSSLRDSGRFESASSSSWYSEDEELISQSPEHSPGPRLSQRQTENDQLDMPGHERRWRSDSQIIAGKTAQAKMLTLRALRASLSTISNGSQRRKGREPADVNKNTLWVQSKEDESILHNDGSMRGNAAFL